MAAPSQIIALAKAVADAAKQQKSAHVIIVQVTANNGVMAINWAALTHELNPDVIDENGYILGTPYMPTDISNALGSIEEFENLYLGGAGQNIEKIVAPIV